MLVNVYEYIQRVVALAEKFYSVPVAGEEMDPEEIQRNVSALRMMMMLATDEVMTDIMLLGEHDGTDTQPGATS
jgi:hypothetical protein